MGIDQNLCSHDAPDQKPGTACIRCGKMLGGAAPEPEVVSPQVEEEETQDYVDHETGSTWRDKK